MLGGSIKHFVFKTFNKSFLYNFGTVSQQGFMTITSFVINVNNFSSQFQNQQT